MSLGYHRKIVDLETLLERVRAVRSAGRTVVQCHGCFDIVHPGHLRYLEFARRQGDLLIVSLTGDAGVDKGAERPYIPQNLRAENLAALEFVDLVYIDPEPSAERLLDLVRPDCYVKGAEYEHSRDPRFLAERNVVERHGGKMIFSSGDVVFSSTRLIAELPSAADGETYRLELTCSRYGIDQSSIRATCERFAELNVLVVGDVILDRYVYCDAIGVASEAPVMSLSHLDERTFVGGAGIIARHVRALGARATLVSRAGDDEASDEARRILEREGVEMRLGKLAGPLPQKTRFLADDVKLFKLDRVCHQPLDSRAEAWSCDVILSSASYDAVIFCDFGCGMITGGLLERCLPELRRRTRTLTADVSGKRANLLNFHDVDLLCPTEREMRAALNDYDSGLSNAAWQLLHRTQARRLIITLGKRGLVTFERPTTHQDSREWSGRLRSETLPSLAPAAVDCLGAGDAMLAGCTLALATGANLLLAAYIGSATAALEVAHVGNIPIDAADLQGWVRRRSELAVASRQVPREVILPPLPLDAAMPV